MDIEKLWYIEKAGNGKFFKCISIHTAPNSYQFAKKLRNKFSDIDQIKLRFTFKMSLEAIKDNFELIWKDLLELIKKYLHLLG